MAQLAASIKHRILECETCEIDCLGPESIFRSLSAMHLAMVFVKRERSEERTLCLRPEEMHVTSGDTQDFSDADQIGGDAEPKPSRDFFGACCSIFTRFLQSMQIVTGHHSQRDMPAPGFCSS